MHHTVFLIILKILKYAQTFGSLLSAKEKQMSTVLSLKATREKQQELIKQLEEKEKNLEIQVVLINEMFGRLSLTYLLRLKKKMNLES